LISSAGFFTTFITRIAWKISKSNDYFWTDDIANCIESICSGIWFTTWMFTLLFLNGKEFFISKTIKEKGYFLRKILYKAKYFGVLYFTSKVFFGFAYNISTSNTKIARIKIFIWIIPYFYLLVIFFKLI